MMSLLARNSKFLYSNAKYSITRSYRPLNNSNLNCKTKGKEKYSLLLKSNYCSAKGTCFTPKKEPKSPCPPGPGKWPTGNRSTYKFNPETETALNAQINAEFKAFYNYLSMASYFNRVDVSLPGCRNYFLKLHREEHEHAMKFIDFINLRGGSVTLCPIEPPPDQDWKCPLNALKTALQLETEVTEKLEAILEIAKKNCDSSTSDFIVSNFIDDQMHSINELGKLISILTGIGDGGLNRYLFDQNLLRLCPDDTNKQNRHGQCT